MLMKVVIADNTINRHEQTLLSNKNGDHSDYDNSDYDDNVSCAVMKC